MGMRASRAGPVGRPGIAARGRGRGRPAAGIFIVPVAVLAAAWSVLDRLRPTGWPHAAGIALGVLGLLSLLGLPAAIRRDRVRRAATGEIDAMSGAAFERRLAVLFTATGYEVEETGRRGDFGADLVVTRAGERAVVQAKRYDGAVGIEAVQQAVGATRHYDAQRAIVVTSSSCTPAASALAASNGVTLVERDELVRWLAAYPDEGSRRRTPGAVAARQVADGGVLVGFAVGLVLRGAWRVARALLRPAGASARRGRGAVR